jgi:putative PIN family toxin of toxin-antitoxin system
VIDTNVYLSRFLRPTSVPGRALERAIKGNILLISTPTLLELRDVLARKKFARYVDPHEAEPFLSRVAQAAEHVHIVSCIHACRHPKDDKFLELAIDGKADLILSGDRDLLFLSPFRNVPIVTPMQYLAED